MENLNLIRKIAWSFHKSTGIEFEDLFSESCLAYYEGLKYYKSEKGKITTFMYFYIPNHLKNYIKKNYTKQPVLISIHDLKIEKESFVEYFYESCTNDAIQISKLILSAPNPYLKKPKKATNRICQLLLRQNWDMPRIWKGIHELKLALS